MISGFGKEKLRDSLLESLCLTIRRRLHSISLNKMEKHDSGAVLDTAMLAGRILGAFVQECPDKSVSETAKAYETGAWLFLTAASTHQAFLLLNFPVKQTSEY
jgi:hypothetical protein